MVASTLAPAAREASREPATLPGGLPLLGHLRSLQRDPFALVTRVRDEVGDIGKLNIGPRTLIIVSDPAAIERVLVDNVRNYSKQTRGYEQLRKMLGNGLVTSEGSFWLRQRRIAQPAFHREKLAGLSLIMQRDTEEMIASWGQRTDVALGFDFSQEMMKLTMRIIGEALFSVDVSGDTDVAGAAINELVHQAIRRTTSLIDIPMSVPTPQNRRFSKSKRTLDALVFGVIQKRRDGKEQKPDLLEMLLEAVDEETGERMTDEQLRDESLTLFAAGHETTSTAVSWTLHALLDTPAAMKKLVDEIDAGDLKPERVLRLPYLDAVLKEGMRLYPPIWNVARLCESDDVVGGMTIKKGELLFLSQWTTHRHPKLWRDPLTFNPERFVVDDPARPKLAYFPFLAGPRKCIGDSLAITEAKIILAHLLQALRFERVPGHAVVPDPAVSLRFKHGLWLRASKRT
ncbi:MAG TPA: cytochrome P450 [Myxococcota bacterium]